MTDENSSAAPASLPEPGPLRDGVAHIALPMRKFTTQLIDALVEHGECDLITDLAIPLPSAASVRPAGLIGIGSLPLIFPAEVHAAH